MRIHIVQKGDTLWKIANRYNVDFEHLLSMNTHLGDPNMIMPGMKVKVPTGNMSGKKQKKEMPMKEAPIKEKPIKESPKEVPVPLPLPMPELPQHLGTDDWQGMEPMPGAELPMEQQPMMPPPPPSMPQMPMPQMPMPAPMPMPQMPYHPCGCQPMPNPCQPISWPSHHQWAPMPAPMQPQEMGECMEEETETMPSYPMHGMHHHHHQPYPQMPQHGIGYPHMPGPSMAQPYYPMQGNHELIPMQQPYPQAPLFSNFGGGNPHGYREHEQDLDEED